MTDDKRLVKIIKDGPVEVIGVLNRRAGNGGIYIDWGVSDVLSVNAALRKCAAYEETGLSPEQINFTKYALKKALETVTAYDSSEAKANLKDGQKDE